MFVNWVDNKITVSRRKLCAGSTGVKNLLKWVKRGDKGNLCAFINSIEDAIELEKAGISIDPVYRSGLNSIHCKKNPTAR